MPVGYCDRCGEQVGETSKARMINIPGSPSWCRACCSEVRAGAGIDSGPRLDAIKAKRLAKERKERALALNPLAKESAENQRLALQELKPLLEALIRSDAARNTAEELVTSIAWGSSMGCLGCVVGAFLLAMILGDPAGESPLRGFLILLIGAGVGTAFYRTVRRQSRSEYEKMMTQCDQAVQSLVQRHPELVHDLGGVEQVGSLERLKEIVEAIEVTVG